MSTQNPSLRELYDGAIDLPAEERGAFLDANCTDIALRTRVQRMLAIKREFAGAMPDTSAEALAESIGEIEPGASQFALGSRIGPFELTGVLGEGGSSTVFRAQRENVDSVRQEVALKLLHRNLHSPDARRQFRRERLALTQLQHPGIARLIEGGVIENGLAYIALDLVEGTPITAYAREHRLDVRARLTLFLQACRAVEAAHRALIVHRDLKPSNVLVNGDGAVKLLDFGIAKLLDDDETQTRLPSFTPAYAAPEQRSGAAITTATDVYALGVLLGELLTGQRLNDGSGRTPSGEIRMDNEPGVLPAKVNIARRQLRGDIDNVVLKAIDAEPDRRYASAGAFADEIERLLEGRPVVAHPPSRWYRTRKFVLRHRGGVAATCALVLALLAALGVALWQANVARGEAQRANAVRKFLMDVFDAAKADLPSNQRPTPETLVHEASRRAREDASINPQLRADFLRTLGTVSLTMGDFAEAEGLLDDALQRQDEAGIDAESAERVDTLIQKGNLLQRTDRNAEADAMMGNILPTLRHQNPDNAISGLTLYATTRLYAGHIDDALAIAQQAAAQAKRLPADSPDAIKAESFPGQVYVVARRWKEGVAQLAPVVARWRALGIPLDIDFAQALNNLATAKDFIGDRADAEALYREGIALRRRIYDGRPNDRLATTLESFSIFLIRHENYDEAQSLLDEALAIDRQVLGPDNLKVASLLDTLGTLEGSRRHFDTAEKHLRAALALYVAHVGQAGQQDNDLALTRMHLGQTLVELGSLDEADALSTQCLAELRKQNGERHDLVAYALILRARIALARGDPTQVMAISEQVTAILAALDTPAQRIEMSVHLIRAQALAAQANHAEAIAEADRAIAIARAALPDAHARLAALLALRARQQQALNQADAATETIAQARALGVPAQLLSAEDAATLAAATR